MEPKGVRLACPQCTFSVVMTSETDCPAGVTKVVEGVPWCPNCPDTPMVPIASVDVTERPHSGITAAMTLEQVATKCVEIQREVAALAIDLKDAVEIHKDAKKAYDAKLVSLSLAVERLGRVMGGEEIEQDKPLLDIAEQAPGRCTSVHDAGAQCVGEAGHGGPHGNGDLSWEEPTLYSAGLFEALRIRLANLHVVVDVEEMERWDVAAYDIVIRYTEMLESGKIVDDVDRPPFLSIDIPEHITALHANLSRLGIIVGLGTICAWTPAQRTEAALWAVTEAETPNGSERPAHVPGAPAEQPRAPRRNKRQLATA